MSQKRILLIMLIMCLVVVLSGTASAGQDNNFDQKIGKIDALLESTVSKESLPYTQGLSVALVNQDGILWSKGYGYQNVEKKVKVSSDTLFRIASLSKSFTATAIMILVERDKVKLSDQLTKHIPGFSVKNEFNQPITIRDLLAHRSGLRRDLEDDDYYKLGSENHPSYQRIMDFLETDKLLFCPGTDFSYSNIGYNLLGKVIENSSGKSYQQFIEQEIFQPLVMDNSYVGLDKENIKLLSKGYKTPFNNQEVKRKPLKYKPAGAIISNVVDLSNYLQFIFKSGTDKNGNQLLNSASLEQMFKQQYPTSKSNRGGYYGLGWLVNGYNGIFNSKFNISHTGYLYGFASSVVAFPNRDVSLIILSNTNSFRGYEVKYTRHVLDILD